MSHHRHRGSDLPESYSDIETFNRCGYRQSGLQVRIHCFIYEMKFTPHIRSICSTLRTIRLLDNVRSVTWTSELTSQILYSIPLPCQLAIPYTLLWLGRGLPCKCPMPARLLTVKLQFCLYPTHFLQNDYNLLVKLKSGLVIDRLHKRNCGKRTGIEQTSVERQRHGSENAFFFLSLCHKTRPL